MLVATDRFKRKTTKSSCMTAKAIHAHGIAYSEEADIPCSVQWGGGGGAILFGVTPRQDFGQDQWED